MLGVPIEVYGFALAVSASVPLLWWAVAGGDRVSEAVLTNLGEPSKRATDVREVELTRSAGSRVVVPLLRALTRPARRLTPSSVVEALEQRIARAGATGRWPVEQVLAGKVLLGVGGCLLGLLHLVSAGTAMAGMLALLMPVAAYGLPDLVLSRRARARQEEILRELPDTFDEITISVEAGLGFEAAMAEAGRSGSGPAAEELIRTLQDIQIGVPRGEALGSLVWRTDVSDLRHFVVAVRQAEQYGVPIAQVLRVQAREMRERRRQRAEERAMQMPVKILIPTVFFILPALFIVILGPAVLRLAESLGGR